MCGAVRLKEKMREGKREKVGEKGEVRTGGCALLLALPLTLRGQAVDTTVTYPWRVSYFPYPVATPNDGLMGIAHVIFFRQSRWDDRVSLHDGIAIDAGYSTKNVWLARVKADFPRIAPGWRLQVMGEARRLRLFADDAAIDTVPRQTA